MKRYESAFVLKSDLEGVVDEEVNASILLRCYSFPVTSMICSADAQGKLTVRRSINANAFSMNGEIICVAAMAVEGYFGPLVVEAAHHSQ